ncbi:unnamed protein product [Bursaphelenchus xylophilus]|uniref:(pine wood nematode) hypothetical protein n=1 Tax=Bursaphelenchus xylophilus TaxID=6326 RepID=A0A1I7SA82_BURXY|nr:unnamed protein product [Bursaphelenchus xylophilus]CAG9084191.1 unnamed protein product [Bursaphelenchus xylophilus]
MVEQNENDVKDAVRKQVEYYFGDINLPRDKFLQEEMKKDEGWIPLETMLKFNRLAKITTDLKVLADSLQESDLIEVSEDKSKIRRSQEVPLPENTLEYWQEIKRRTVYVKGFPQDTTLDEIQTFVNPHGDIKNVLMRRLKKEKTFKGSVFVTFSDRESAEKFSKDEASTTFKDIALTKLMQDDYWAKKSQETKQKRQAEKDLKKRKQAEQKAEEEKNALASCFVKGAVLEVSGLGSEAFKYDDLKVFFKKFGPVAFVAYEAGNDKAQIRFDAKEEGVAEASWKKAEGEEGKVVFNGKELTSRVLEGEEEEAYWTEFTKSKVAKNDRSHKKFGRRPDKRSARGDVNIVNKKAKHTVFNEDDQDGDASEESKQES